MANLENKPRTKFCEPNEHKFALSIDKNRFTIEYHKKVHRLIELTYTFSDFSSTSDNLVESFNVVHKSGSLTELDVLISTFELMNSSTFSRLPERAARKNAVFPSVCLKTEKENTWVDHTSTENDVSFYSN